MILYFVRDCEEVIWKVPFMKGDVLEAFNLSQQVFKGKKRILVNQTSEGSYAFEEGDFEVIDKDKLKDILNQYFNKSSG